MATTSAELAATALDCLAASGAELAVLHGEEAVARGDCSSDVDLVTREPAARVIARAHAALRRRDLHPVVVWPYDVGSASVFVVDACARRGAQLDILHDADGAGRYGVRAGAVLANAGPGVRWRRAAPDDELLYLLRKRLSKGQHDRVGRLLAATADRPVSPLRVRATELLSGPSAAAVTAALDGTPPPRDRLRRVRADIANTGRVVSRLRRPVGFWVTFDGDAARPMAELTAARFGSVLPAAGCGPTPHELAGLARKARRIASVRWRAGVYASWGPAPRPVNPDLASTAQGTADEVMTRVVAAMEQRLRP